MQKEITTPGVAGRGLSFCILLHTVPQLETGLGAVKTELGSGVTYAAAKLESQCCGTAALTKHPSSPRFVSVVRCWGFFG